MIMYDYAAFSILGLTICALVITGTVQVMITTNTKPEASLNFHVIGDYGELHPRWNFTTLPCKVVAESMNNIAGIDPISMVITTGDNFYASGKNFSLDSTIEKVFSDNFFKKSNLKDKEWYLSWGNHDAYFKVNLDKIMTEKYGNVYMHRKPWNLTKEMDGFKVDFMFLPPEIVCLGVFASNKIKSHCKSMGVVNQNIDDYYDWIEEHMVEISKDPKVYWKIFVIHYPIFSLSIAGMDTESLKFYLLPILRKYGVDLVLSGHNHHMEYSVSFPDKHKEYITQDKRDDCQPQSNINCGGFTIHCYTKNTTCPDKKKNCKNKISVESSPGLQNYTQKVVFRKGEALHQVVQGGGGADLDPFCPKLTSPMSDLLFGLIDFGFTSIKATSSELSIKYYIANTSKLVFESIIERY